LFNGRGRPRRAQPCRAEIFFFSLGGPPGARAFFRKKPGWFFFCSGEKAQLDLGGGLGGAGGNVWKRAGGFVSPPHNPVWGGRAGGQGDWFGPGGFRGGGNPAGPPKKHVDGEIVGTGGPAGGTGGRGDRFVFSGHKEGAEMVGGEKRREGEDGKGKKKKGEEGMENKYTRTNEEYRYTWTV